MNGFPYTLYRVSQGPCIFFSYLYILIFKINFGTPCTSVSCFSIYFFNLGDVRAHLPDEHDFEVIYQGGNELDDSYPEIGDTRKGILFQPDCK